VPLTAPLASSPAAPLASSPAAPLASSLTAPLPASLLPAGVIAAITPAQLDTVLGSLARCS
jgi:hypothetical protein